jgi:carbon storage regulator
MLVLSRKVGERIHVGDDITIEIRRIAGNRVTIALGAPRDVRILRGELERASREFREGEPERAAQPPEGKPCVPLPSGGRESLLNGLPSGVSHSVVGP